MYGHIEIFISMNEDFPKMAKSILGQNLHDFKDGGVKFQIKM